MAQFNVAFSAGRFDRPMATLVESTHRLRKGRTLVAGTEASSRNNTFLKADLGWDYTHLKGVDGECYATWNDKFWTQVGPSRTRILSSLTWVRSTGYGGKRAAPVRALVVPLAPVHDPHQKIFVLVTHMPLDNTALRAFIWKACARGLVRLIRRLRRRNPGCKIIVFADFNKNYRQKEERELIRVNICGPTGLKQGWDRHVPATGGTHGSRSLLDDMLTDLPITAQDLLADDPSSDHRPFGSTITV